MSRSHFRTIRAIALWDSTWERRSHFRTIRAIALSDNKRDRALTSSHRCRH
ncbi:hypothetical protein [Microcoleus sp.]|uniref:hypothetical protein n=1 Tax=Microcoleus sp. TaxID=44472 RepID=UPI0035253816